MWTGVRDWVEESLRGQIYLLLTALLHVLSSNTTLMMKNIRQNRFSNSRSLLRKLFDEVV